MKALVLEDIGKLEYRDMPMPVPGKDEVLIKVMAAGICGSDIQRVYKDGAHKMPLIIGHEFSGLVEEAGEGAGQWSGKRVGVFPLIPCRKCGPCLAGQFEMCRDYDYLGSRRDGGFAEYVIAPQQNLIELPDSVSYEEAAMLEPMSVDVHAMRRITDHENIPKDAAIAVIGLGTIGTFLVMFLLDAGYKNLIVIGNKDFQKKTMEDLGVPAERYCDSGKEDVTDHIMRFTGNNGADVFFECVGSADTASTAVDLTAPAGNVCFIGNPFSDMTFSKPVYWKILRNQLRLTGTWNSSFCKNAGDDWHYVLDRLGAGQIKPERMITQRYSLDGITRGFELMRDKTEEYIKVMFTA